ncbi:MAG: GSCFA domain-containing protein [Bacteroidales bacterium]|nr:GSCFA domain-containing protein [Bacteroidales bacterium]
MKFFSQVVFPPLESPFSLQDRIVLLGSCFADSIGEKMAAAGFDVMVNPFGTLYNPASIEQAVQRLDSGKPFGLEDCVQMGAGAGRICSFWHHTSFARATAEEFLSNANAKLQQASEFWKSANRLVLTLGTSFVWRHDGRIVANCLKRPAGEFTREMLTVEQSSECLRGIASAHPEKKILLTVSPIRHLGDGAHANALSKARLLLAADTIAAEYFPAYEIMMDELRDYRFYADDLVHPSPAAVSYIWERFLATAVLPSDLDQISRNQKEYKQQSHRPNMK